jgi:hypothetical protein
MQAVFNYLIDQLKNPASAYAKNAAHMLTIDPTRLPTVIESRMSQTPNFFDSIMSINTRNHEAQFERQFAANNWVPPDLWITFVEKLGKDLKQQALLQQQQVRQAQLQEQQLRQKQQQLHLTPEQHAKLQQQTRLMHENWDRIRTKLQNCEDYHTKLLSKLLNIPCDIFRHILTYRGENLAESLYSNELDVAEETRFISEVVNPGLQENGTSLIDPTNWIHVINFLRESLRLPFTQPDESHENQDTSRMLEPSPDPRMGRPTPLTGVGRRGQDIVGSHDLDQIKAYLNKIIDDRVMFREYIELIRNVIGTQLTPITPAEYEQLFGGAYSPQLKLLPVENVLSESFNSKGFDKTLVDTAFQYACRAYLHADRTDHRILSELERNEPEPKRLYVIARLMLHFLTFRFDRTEGMHLGGKKSRSKKRGRKSVHRRKKSSHKKRKSKKN